MRNILKTATVGAGGYARTYLKELYRLAETGKIDFRAAVIVNPAELPAERENLARFGVTICSSMEELHRKFPDLDLVCVPTAIAAHESLTVDALRHGSSVLVEKPASGSVESVRRMIAARNEAGKLVTVGFQHVHSSRIAEFKRKILSGEYGKVRRIAVVGLWPRGDAYYARNGWSGRLFAPDGTRILDSPLNNALAHYLNFPLYLCGDRFETGAGPVAVEGWTRRAREMESFDSCALKFKVSSGAEILYMVSHTVAENIGPLVRIECENALVEWTPEHWRAVPRSGKREEGPVGENQVSEMFDAVTDRLSGKDVFTCPLEIALNHTMCAEMVWREIPVDAVPAAELTRCPDGTFVAAGLAERFLEGFRNFTLPEESVPVCV